jgi:hypothetical protein
MMNDFHLPREISLASKLHLFFFYKTISIVGLFFLIVSVTLVLFFFPYIDFSQFYLNENSPKTKGILTDIIPTSIKEGTERVFKFNFYYRAGQDSKTYTLTSYGRNPVYFTQSGLKSQYKSGDTVRVVYSYTRPEIAKIEGMYYKPAPFFLLILMLIPVLIGIILLLSQIPNYIKTLRLIREGEIGEALFISMTHTNVKINNRRVMKLLFRYKTKAGEHEFTYKTNHPEPYRNPQLKHPILYDPENPKRAILIRELPKSIRNIILDKN